MKYLAVLIIAGGAYLYLSHKAPVAQAVQAVTENSGQGTDFLKRPLDRTHEVLQQARTRADDPALK